MRWAYTWWSIGQWFSGPRLYDEEMEVMTIKKPPQSTQTSTLHISCSATEAIDNDDGDDIYTALLQQTTKSRTMPFVMAWKTVHRKLLMAPSTSATDNFFKFHCINSQDKFEKELNKKELVDARDEVDIKGLIAFLRQLEEACQNT